MDFDHDEMKERLCRSLHAPLRAAVGYNMLVLERACESPIEVAFGVALLVADQLEHPYMRAGLFLAETREADTYRPDLALLIPQYPWHGYRIDFALRLPRYRFKYLFVECDGHDFHERTKEQAARDRMKDREIQQSGFPVLRFTGSEIHRDAASCAAQTIDFINQRYDDYQPQG